MYVTERVSDLERAVLYSAGTDECDDDGDHVDGELELQELGDGVVHVAAPHHGLHYGREVVVRQDDVRRFLGHVSSRDTLKRTRWQGSSCIYKLTAVYVYINLNQVV